MKPIRVLLVSPAHPPTDPRIVHKQAPTLSTRYNVTCLLPHAKAGMSGPIRFIRLPLFRWLGWRLLLVHPLILWHIVRLRPQILHICMPELLPIALLCRLFGLNVVYEVQENLRLKFDRKRYNNHPVFQRAFAGFEQLARHYCYHVFTEDSYLATYTGLKLPYALVHNYPDPAFFDSLSQPSLSTAPVTDGPHLLYVGVVSFDRGLDTMIETIALLAAHYPAIRLHLFGRCAFARRELEAVPAYAEVRDHMVFYGQTDPKIAYTGTTRYIAGLALLKPVGDYPGSYPTKLFEYMAASLPVLTADFPLYRAVVESAQCGYCVEPADSSQVAQKLISLIEHPDEAALMGKRGRLVSTYMYNWQTEANQLLGLYNSIALC